MGMGRMPCDFCKEEHGALYDCRSGMKSAIRLADHKPPADPLADFYGKIRDTAKLTDGITLAERIAVLDVVRAELVRDFQSQIDAAEE